MSTTSPSFSSRQAALIAGLGYLAIFIVVTFANSFALEKVIVEGDAAREKLLIIKQGSLGKADQARLLREVQGTIADAEKLAGGELFEAEGNMSPKREIRKLRREVAKLEGRDCSVSPLEHLSKTQRRAYQRVFSLIYECAPNRTVAKVIVDRVVARL